MCTLTVSDFDALDALDANAVLTVGDIIASEKRADRLRMVLSPMLKGAGQVLQKAIANETRLQQKLETQGQHVPGEKPRGVIVH